MKTLNEAAKQYAEETCDQSMNVTVDMLKEYAYTDFNAGAQFMREKAIEAFRQFVENYCEESGIRQISNNSEHYMEIFKKEIN